MTKLFIIHCSFIVKALPRKSSEGFGEVTSFVKPDYYERIFQLSNIQTASE